MFIETICTLKYPQIIGTHKVLVLLDTEQQEEDKEGLIRQPGWMDRSHPVSD